MPSTSSPSASHTWPTLLYLQASTDHRPDMAKSVLWPGGTIEITDEAAAYVDVEEGWSRFGLNRLVFRLKDRNMRNRTVARLAQVIRDTTGGQPTVGELTQQKKERALPLAFKN